MRPHPFVVPDWGGGGCEACGCEPTHPLHVLTLPGMEDVAEQRAEAQGVAEAQRIAERLRTSHGSVDARTREIEQHSPLFTGTDANPLGRLF